MEILQYFSEDFLSGALGTVVMFTVVFGTVFWKSLKEDGND